MHTSVITLSGALSIDSTLQPRAPAGRQMCVANLSRLSPHAVQQCPATATELCEQQHPAAALTSPDASQSAEGGRSRGMAPQARGG